MRTRPDVSRTYLWYLSSPSHPEFLKGCHMVMGNQKIGRKPIFIRLEAYVIRFIYLFSGVSSTPPATISLRNDFSWGVNILDTNRTNKYKLFRDGCTDFVAIRLIFVILCCSLRSNIVYLGAIQMVEV